MNTAAAGGAGNRSSSWSSSQSSTRTRGSQVVGGARGFSAFNRSIRPRSARSRRSRCRNSGPGAAVAAEGPIRVMMAEVVEEAPVMQMEQSAKDRYATLRLHSRCRTSREWSTATPGWSNFRVGDDTPGTADPNPQVELRGKWTLAPSRGSCWLTPCVKEPGWQIEIRHTQAEFPRNALPFGSGICVVGIFSKPC